MNHLATLVLAGADTQDVRTLHDCFTSNSYAGLRVTSGAAALEEVRRARPDVLVVGAGLIFSTIKVLYCGTAKPLIFLG